MMIWAYAPSCDFIEVAARVYFSFGTLTLLVGRQEGHPSCKRAGSWFVGGDDLTGVLHDL